jgi:prophage DNA circulation protein
VIDETIQVAQTNGQHAVEQIQETVEETVQQTVEAVEATVERTSAQVQSMTDIQKEVFAALQEIGQEWLAKAESEMRLASEFSAKLAGLRSVPEVAAAYRDWWKQRLTIMAEDGRRLCENTEKLISTSSRYLGNGSRD